MMINKEVKAVIEESAFISIVSMNADNTPHPIVAGGGKVMEDTIIFGIYKMEITQSNITKDHRLWVTAATMNGTPKGYRLFGTARVQDKELIFSPQTAEAMI